MEDQAKQRSGMFSLQNVQLYEDGVNCNWTQDFARIALRGIEDSSSLSKDLDFMILYDGELRRKH